ncbi:hypothetical protein AB2I81_09185 [Escherichia coli]
MEGESLRAICRRDEFPHLATVLAWLHRHDEFHEQYARAREIQAEVMVRRYHHVRRLSIRRIRFSGKSQASGGCKEVVCV